jgi:hypothetical protein
MLYWQVEPLVILRERRNAQSQGFESENSDPNLIVPCALSTPPY